MASSTTQSKILKFSFQTSLLKPRMFYGISMIQMCSWQLIQKRCKHTCTTHSLWKELKSFIYQNILKLKKLTNRNQELSLSSIKILSQLFSKVALSTHMLDLMGLEDNICKPILKSINGEEMKILMKAIWDTSFKVLPFTSIKTALRSPKLAKKWVFNSLSVLENNAWNILSFTMLKPHSKCARTWVWSTLSKALNTRQRSLCSWDMLLQFYSSMIMPKIASSSHPSQSLL